MAMAAKPPRVHPLHPSKVTLSSPVCATSSHFTLRADSQKADLQYCAEILVVEFRLCIGFMASSSILSGLPTFGTLTGEKLVVPDSGATHYVPCRDTAPPPVRCPGQARLQRCGK